MDVILLTDVEKVGLRGEVVTVSRGYMRNYLSPRRLAEPATPAKSRSSRSARPSAHSTRRAASNRRRTIAETLPKTVLRFEVKAGTQGVLFGSITPTDIADELWRVRKIRVDRRKIDLAEPDQTGRPLRDPDRRLPGRPGRGQDAGRARRRRAPARGRAAGNGRGRAGGGRGGQGRRRARRRRSGWRSSSRRSRSRPRRRRGGWPRAAGSRLGAPAEPRRGSGLERSAAQPADAEPVPKLRAQLNRRPQARPHACGRLHKLPALCGRFVRPGRALPVDGREPGDASSDQFENMCSFPCSEACFSSGL